jgi:hypothetical protein
MLSKPTKRQATDDERVIRFLVRRFPKQSSLASELDVKVKIGKCWRRAIA